MPSKPVYKPTPGAISIPKWILKLSMRARFLATDYFASHSRIKTLRDYQFLPLPLQNLPPFDPPLGIEIPFFDLDLCFPSEIYGFLIENALSQFLSDVVPRFLHAGEGTSIDSSSRNRKLERFRSGLAKIGVSERRDDDSWEEENRESWECSDAGADAVDVLDDNIDIEVGVTIPHPITVAKSFFSVEDISARLNDDQDTFSVKHGSSSLDRTLNQCSRLPQFEICKNS
uniref:Uncharacterized protein LOC105044986 isoform X4 n=1 Tax=Elaeis guineensis var. tenera TaxID=51953 RepID=A0A8N4F3D4_ELAGV|nr:uncharacterized protein LOC105044986 isoform X4 [Elaeis guineensis]